MHLLEKRKTIFILAGIMLVTGLLLTTNLSRVYAATPCGSGDSRVEPAIELGCTGKGNSILDMIFAFIRFLSIGVGLVVIGSLVVAGIQYTASRGDPQATANAMKRIYSTLGALLLYIFLFAIINWLVPGMVLQ